MKTLEIPFITEPDTEEQAEDLICIFDALGSINKLPKDSPDWKKVNGLHWALKVKHNILVSKKDCKKLLGID